MKMYRLYISIILIALTLGCEKIIDIDIPEGERKIVLNGLINPDSLVKVNISRSLSVLENNEFVYLENAGVKLYRDDTELGTLAYLGSGFYELADYNPESGYDYRLEVNYQGLNSVTAITQLLNPIEYSEIDTSSTTDEWGGGSLKVSFSFTDPPEQDYYAISVTATHKVFDYYSFTYLDSLTTYPIYFDFINSSEGPQSMFIEEGTTTYYGNKAFFADDLFNGKKMNIDLGIGKYSFFDADTVWLKINLEHVSQPYYFYAISSGKYDQSAGNPFAEPVSVYTNVENGLGIFSGYSFFRRELEILVDIGR